MWPARMNAASETANGTRYSHGHARQGSGSLKFVSPSPLTMRNTPARKHHPPNVARSDCTDARIV
jgi:hypothetical protein